MAIENPYSTPEGELVTNTDEYGSTAIFSSDIRIGRARYLARCMLTYVLFYFVILAVGGLAAVTGSNENLMAGLTGIVVIVFAIVITVFFFIYAIQRLHDLNHSGWLSLLMLIPLVNAIFGLYLIFAPGIKGSNNYGAPPPPNTVGIWLGATLFPIIMIIGIIAAISIPAYQDYIERAQQKAEQQQ